jgi:predicted transporter
MEWKTLVLGLLFSYGVFGAKSGVGLYYLLERTHSSLRRLGYAAAFFASYAFVFAVSFVLITQIDFLRHLQAFQRILAAGMWLHLLVAAGLLCWGAYLLRSKPSSSQTSAGWLALTIPCPVCFTVILLSTSLLMAVFPERGGLAVLTAWLTFTSLSLLSCLIMYMTAHRFKIPPDTLLGYSMLFISIYFLLTVLIAPQWSDLDKIYRIAVYTENKRAAEPFGISELAMIGGMALAFLAGFGLKSLALGRRTRWSR